MAETLNLFSSVLRKGPGGRGRRERGEDRDFYIGNLACLSIGQEAGEMDDAWLRSASLQQKRNRKKKKRMA